MLAGVAYVGRQSARHIAHVAPRIIQLSRHEVAARVGGEGGAAASIRLLKTRHAETVRIIAQAHESAQIKAMPRVLNIMRRRHKTSDTPAVQGL